VWSYPISVAPRPLTGASRVDVAIVGAGFTGLATAFYVLHHRPELRVAVFEAEQVGAGASGRTGGLILEDTAVGPLPGVEDCIATLHDLVTTQGIACDLQLGHCWEIGRQNGQPSSPIQWSDHGTLQVVHVKPGGAFDPRKFLAGMAERVQASGGHIFEHAPVTDINLEPAGEVRLDVAGTAVYAVRVVFATNAFCLPVLGLQDRAGGVHTIAVATEALADAVFDAIGWSTHTPFYTLDLPYLWGRVTADNRIVMGGGLTGRDNIQKARADAPEAVELFDRLEGRILKLNPALHDVRMTHRWIGPIGFTLDNKPLLTSWDEEQRVLIATGYRGHGVALSVRVGKLMAEVLTGQGHLPVWDTLEPRHL
jgi:glycine/D-amino acid oxidase-like deaminating enzyme